MPGCRTSDYPSGTSTDCWKLFWCHDLGSLNPCNLWVGHGLQWLSHTEPKHAQRDDSIGLAQRDIYIFHVASCGIKSALIKLQQAPKCDQVSTHEKRAIHVVKMLKELRWDGCHYCISQLVTATTIKYLLAFCVEMLRAWIVGSLDRWCSPQTWYTVLQLFLQTTSNRAKMKLDS